jgi:hypothetical protein
VKKPPRIRPRQLQIETLEKREVMTAGVTANLSNGLLIINDTVGDDQIYVKQTGGYISIDNLDTTWKASSVNWIIINVHTGNDFICLDSLHSGGSQVLKEKITVNTSNYDAVRVANGHTVWINNHANRLDVTSSGVVSLNGGVFNFTGAVQAKLSSGVLTLTGTVGSDNIQFKQVNGYISINGVSGSWKASSVTAINVYLQNGTDNVSLHSLENGGNQPLSELVKVFSGAGSQTVRLANGHNVQFDGLSHLLEVAADGTATLDGQVLSFNDPTPPTPPDPDPPAQNWFDTNVQDAALRSLGHNLYTDGLIDRSDIINLLRDSEDGGVVDATELNDLRLIAATSSLFGSGPHIQVLTNYVVNYTVANNKYQGQNMGSLAAGSSAAHMENLINKWFLGLDRPSASGTYRQMSGQLFVNGATYGDVKQGSVGDCYFVAALAEAAFRNANLITSMFIVNGDGTYTVRMYNGSTPWLVTVDSYLPTNASGNLIYAGIGANYANSGNELWVALAEKAYVQLNEFGFTRPGLPGTGQNAYSAINGGYIYAAVGHITGQSTSPFTMTANSTSFTTFVNAYNAGKLIGFASYATTPAGSGVVGSHAYAVVGYNATNQTVTLFNPWGTQYGLLTLTWSQVQASFQYFDRTV